MRPPPRKEGSALVLVRGVGTGGSAMVPWKKGSALVVWGTGASATVGWVIGSALVLVFLVHWYLIHPLCPNSQPRGLAPRVGIVSMFQESKKTKKTKRAGMGVGGWVEGGWSWLGILVWVFSSDTAPRSGGGIYLSRTPRAQIRHHRLPIERKAEA